MTITAIIILIFVIVLSIPKFEAFISYYGGDGDGDINKFDF